MHYVPTSPRRRLPRGAIQAAATAAGIALAACGSSSGGTGHAATTSSGSGKAVHIAYLSFAVENSYDAPMLAAAQAVASDDHASLKVFDANNSPQTQFSQLQDAIASGQYNGIIVQPIFGTGLTSLVKQAVAKGIKIVNMDQILGPNLATDQPQVSGMAGNVVFVPTEIGTKLGNLVVQGQSFFSPTQGLTAVQNMLQANPSLSLIVGSDQGIEGGAQALQSAHKTGKVILVGYGASAAALAGVSSGAWYADVAQAPASEGRLAVQELVQAVRTGKNSAGQDPVAQLPNGGVVTKANVSQFTAEWPG